MHKHVSYNPTPTNTVHHTLHCCLPLQNTLNSIAAQRTAAAAAGGDGSSSSSGSIGLDAAVLAGRALYITELTKKEPRWADWVQQNDNSLVGPEVCVCLSCHYNQYIKRGGERGFETGLVLDLSEISFLLSLLSPAPCYYTPCL
jgi:hypothetical protein